MEQRSLWQGATAYDRKIDLEDLTAEITRQAREKEDFVVDSRNLKMVLRGGEPRLTFTPPEITTRPNQEYVYGITPWAHKQVAQKTGIPVRYYRRMQGEAPELLTENVNEWLPSTEQRQIRTLDGKVRALVSDRYRTLDNVDLFFAAARVFGEVDARVIRADLSPTRFYLRAVQPGVRTEIEQGDEVISGVVLSNSEVGAGSLRLEAFCYRLVCLNGLIGEDVFKRIHIGTKLEEGIYSAETMQKTSEAIWGQVSDALRASFDEDKLEEWADQFRDAKKVDIPEPTKLVRGSWTGLDVTEKEKDEIIRRMVGTEMTQFGLVNAVSAQARESTDAERRTELEKLGNEILGQDEEAFETTIRKASKVVKSRS